MRSFSPLWVRLRLLQLLPLSLLPSSSILGTPPEELLTESDDAVVDGSERLFELSREAAA